MPTPDDPAPPRFLPMFDDPQAVARYAEGVRRFVPGLDALHRMTGILLAEQAGPPDATVLVLGAGGGLELKALAEAHPGWSFVGVDPSREMLRQAGRTLGPLSERVVLVEGTIDDAPAGPFDAATCLLTLHFFDADRRTETLRAIHRRLKPGGPFVAAHASFPQGTGERDRWLTRYAAYAAASGAPLDDVDRARAAVDASLALFSPERDAEILGAAGFRHIELFFAAFTWRGWSARA